jgi:hypothetical protein
MPRRLGGVGRKLAAGDRKIERGHVFLVSYRVSCPGRGAA